MSLIEAPRYLFDVNVLIALLDQRHTNHSLVSAWFATPGLQWAICPFTEAGFLRYATRPALAQISMEEATAMLSGLASRPGYRFQPILADWQTLCGRFAKRLFGHKQITDAYLLGLAVHEGLVLVTFDKAIVHLAGEHGKHVLLLAG